MKLKIVSEGVAPADPAPTGMRLAGKLGLKPSKVGGERVEGGQRE